jgi:nitrite reductase/ring-hydroxylating ferredoxin subunit
MTLTSVCSVGELEEGDRIIEEVNGTEVAVFNLQGEYRAVVNYCVHQSGPICEGSVTGTTTAKDDEWEYGWEKEGEIINCPWHGWEFDLNTGEHLSNPEFELITYDVVIEDDVIKVKTK